MDLLGAKYESSARGSRSIVLCLETKESEIRVLELLMIKRQHNTFCVATNTHHPTLNNPIFPRFTIS